MLYSLCKGRRNLWPEKLIVKSKPFERKYGDVLIKIGQLIAKIGEGKPNGFNKEVLKDVWESPTWKLEFAWRKWSFDELGEIELIFSPKQQVSTLLRKW